MRRNRNGSDSVTLRSSCSDRPTGQRAEDDHEQHQHHHARAAQVIGEFLHEHRPQAGEGRAFAPRDATLHGAPPGSSACRPPRGWAAGRPAASASRPPSTMRCAAAARTSRSATTRQAPLAFRHDRSARPRCRAGRRRCRCPAASTRIGWPAPSTWLASSTTVPISAILPLLNSATRSQTLCTRSSRCEDSSTATPVRLQAADHLQQLEGGVRIEARTSARRGWRPRPASSRSRRCPAAGACRASRWRPACRRRRRAARSPAPP